MWELPIIELTDYQKQQYQAYTKEWRRRKLSHPEEFVDWSISNNVGDPFNEREWLDKKYLHNF